VDSGWHDLLPSTMIPRLAERVLIGLCVKLCRIIIRPTGSADARDFCTWSLQGACKLLILIIRQIA
jgi:hypothetical protein